MKLRRQDWWLFVSGWAGATLIGVLLIQWSNHRLNQTKEQWLLSSHQIAEARLMTEQKVQLQSLLTARELAWQEVLSLLKEVHPRAFTSFQLAELPQEQWIPTLQTKVRQWREQCKKAELKVPTGGYTFSFTELPYLSPEAHQHLLEQVRAVEDAVQALTQNGVIELSAIRRAVVETRRQEDWQVQSKGDRLKVYPFEFQFLVPPHRLHAVLNAFWQSEGWWVPLELQLHSVREVLPSPIDMEKLSATSKMQSRWLMTGSEPLRVTLRADWVVFNDKETKP